MEVRELLKAGGAALVVRALGVIFGFALALLLARLLGAEGYGRYAIVITVVTILLAPAQLGSNVFVIRTTAAASVRADWGSMRAHWAWSGRLIGLATAGIVVAMAAAALLWSRFAPDAPTLLIYAASLLIVYSLTRTYGSRLAGLQHPVLAVFPEQALRPGLLLALVLLFLAVSDAQSLSPTTALGAHLAAATAAALVALIVLKREIPPAARNATYEPAALPWQSTLGPLLVITVLDGLMQHFDLLLVAWLDGDEAAGVYRIAVQLATLIALPQLILTSVTRPRLAALHAEEQLPAMEQLTRSATLLASGCALAGTLLLVVSGNSVIEVAVGSEFAQAYPVMVVLLLARLLSACFGPGATILALAGQERKVRDALLIALGLLVVGCLLLVPFMGALGAAIAQAAALTFWSARMRADVRRSLSIETMVLRKPRFLPA